MRLAELIIENFRGVGEPIRIKINDIVILIGKNNAGKTTVLKAYEAFSSMGGPLGIRDFYQERVENKPTITGIFDEVTTEEIAEKWIHKDDELGYENCIKAQFRWESPGVKGVKYSYDPEKGEYIKGGLGGFDSILSNRIPTPICISPLDDPVELEKNILSILTEAIKENIKKDQSSVEKLLNQIEGLAKSVQQEIREEIEESCKHISRELEKVFPEFNHVEIDAKASKLEPEKLINAGSFIRIGNNNEKRHMPPLLNHGTGLQRTFLWAALKMLAETGRHKIGRTTIDSEKQKILLIEEPEAFLHPHAIKEARESLYAIAELNNWQVMATSHSPVFIDLTKDHTTIIRLEKNEQTKHTVKTFTTNDTTFTEDDRENLKMLNFCNPYFNEFFFASNNLLVEGETEYSVIKAILEKNQIGKDIHVLNCFGKANIVTVSKILNHFSVSYSILHDSDNPKAKRNDTYIRNSAWSINEKIIREVIEGRKKNLDIKTFVSIPNFEGEFMEGEKARAKPYEAWRYFQKENNEMVARFIDFLRFLQGEKENCSLQYKSMDDIIQKVEEHIKLNKLEEDPLWELEEIAIFV